MNKEQYPEIPSDRADDLHNLEIIDKAQLVLFMAGNQFMVMDDLIQSFQERRPQVKNIFYETLPPGLELKQILAHGALFPPTKVLSASADSLRRTIKLFLAICLP